MLNLRGDSMAVALARISKEGEFVVIDAKGMHYRELNALIEEVINRGAKKLKLINVNGQRFIADGLRGDYYIEIHGVAGDDLGAFANGPTIVVYGDVQDGAGNTMNAGRIIVHGDGTDIIGHSMRGGKVFVRGHVGYRVGIHMKEYMDQVPVLVIGGTAGDFLGEYMAGGRIIILGLERLETYPEIVGDWLATGIHGGAIYLRDAIDEDKLGYGAKFEELTEEDLAFLRREIGEFCSYFGGDVEEIMKVKFTKVVPLSHRPFAAMYSDSKEAGH